MGANACSLSDMLTAVGYGQDEAVHMSIEIRLRLGEARLSLGRRHTAEKPRDRVRTQSTSLDEDAHSSYFKSNAGALDPTGRCSLPTATRIFHFYNTLNPFERRIRNGIEQSDQ